MSEVGVSFDEIEFERCQRRRKAVVALGQLDQPYRHEIERYRETCHHFFQLLDQAPKEAVYIFGRTTGKLLDVRDSLHVFQRQLVAGNVRLHIGGQYRTSLAAAKWLVAKYDASFLQNHVHAGPKTIRAHAIALVDSEILKVEEELTALRNVRRSLVVAAQAILKRVHEAARLGLMSRSDSAVVEIETLVEYCFPGSTVLGPSYKAVREAQMKPATSRLGKHGVRRSFQIVTGLVYKHIETMLPSVLEQKKQAALRAAARQLVSELDSFRLRTAAFDRLATAILALRFSFTSAREGLGGLSTADEARYQRELAAASGTDVRSAIETLMSQELITADDCDLFRYTPSVGRPFPEYVVVQA